MAAADRPTGSGPGAQTGARAGGAAGRTGRALRGTWRVCVTVGAGLAVMVVLAAGLLVVRLREGPLAVPLLAPIAERILEARIAGVLPGSDLRVGHVVIALGAGEEPTGLRLRDVRLTDARGALLFSARGLGARVALGDLVRGDFAPSAIFVRGARGIVRRDAEGRFAAELAEPEGDAPAPDTTGTDPFGMFVGQVIRGEIPALRALDVVRFTDMTLVYDDAISGRRWVGQDGALRLLRTARGVDGQLTLRLDNGPAPPTALTLTATHRIGSGVMDLDAAVADAQPADIAAQFPVLAWIAPLDAPVAGRLAGQVALSGDLNRLSATLDIGRGTIRAGAERVSLDHARLALDYAAADGRLTLAALSAETGFGRVSAQGEGTLVRDDAGVPRGIVADLILTAPEVAAPGLLAAPVPFDRGRIGLRVRFDPATIEIGEATLLHGSERISARGTVRRMPEGVWDIALDANAVGVTSTRLVALWPLTAAPGARDWVATGMPAGVIDRLHAGFRLRDDAPQAALTFSFRDAVAYPLPTLPPITGAAGVGTLDMASLSLTLQSGVATPPGGGPIDMTGSVFRIPALFAQPTEADVQLKGRGSIGSALRLIDTPPLGLLGKVGASPDLGEGDAAITAHLRFALLKALKTTDVAVEAAARLTDVRLARPVAGLAVSSPALELVATSDALTLRGPVALGPARAALDWTETFAPPAGTPPSQVRATLDITPDLLAALGAGPAADLLDGRAPAVLTASLGRDGGPRFTLEADLGGVGVRLPGLGQMKPRGDAGAISLTGVMGPGLALRDIVVDAGRLQLRGTADLTAEGRLSAARFGRIAIGEALASSLVLAPGAAPRLEGGWLDLLALGELAEGGGTAAPDPGSEGPEVTLALDELRLTPRLAIAPGAGMLRPNATPLIEVAGRINGGSPATLAVVRAEGGMAARLIAEDAGQALRDSAYFTGGAGGRLTLTLAVEPGGGATGRMSIQGISVRNSQTLSRILSIASITGVLESLTTGGLYFDTVEAPFRRSGGQLTLGEARATGPSIGISMSGVYDETADRLDLSGVLSPAYLLNGLLGNVPLVGDILTGGRSGEGIFGIAYSVRGSASDPDVAVNPLSILAPGVLRNIFRRAPTPSPDMPSNDAFPPDANAPPPPVPTGPRFTRQDR